MYYHHYGFTINFWLLASTELLQPVWLGLSLMSKVLTQESFQSPVEILLPSPPKGRASFRGISLGILQLVSVKTFHSLKMLLGVLWHFKTRNRCFRNKFAGSQWAQFRLQLRQVPGSIDLTQQKLENAFKEEILKGFFMSPRPVL